MAQSHPGATPSGAPTEPLLDEMIDETFPASDAPQLSGRARTAPRTAPEPAPRDTTAHMAAGSPPTIGNQGAIPASGVLQETFPVNDQDFITLRFDGAHQRLHIALPEGDLALDAQSLDRLIAVLSTKRAAMTER
jgi:hypothetical protein